MAFTAGRSGWAGGDCVVVGSGVVVAGGSVVGASRVVDGAMVVEVVFVVVGALVVVALVDGGRLWVTVGAALAGPAALAGSPVVDPESANAHPEMMSTPRAPKEPQRARVDRLRATQRW
ncbi:MAG: hypothetical protein KUG57_11075 [Ilumatobacteraceae bacterium]|nr:hypothetical protein [Ilumatobacteraceae bacterium]